MSGRLIPFTLFTLESPNAENDPQPPVDGRLLAEGRAQLLSQSEKGETTSGQGLELESVTELHACKVTGSCA